MPGPDTIPRDPGTVETQPVEIKKNPNQASIQHLILIDREVDYITPLLTQQVYTGNFMKSGVVGNPNADNPRNSRRLVQYRMWPSDNASRNI